MKRHTPLIAMILAGVGLAGCTDPGFHGNNAVRIATAGEVGSCRLIENLSMEPGVYGPVLGGQGVKYARNKMLDTAAKDGANTVVFDENNAAGTVTNVTGKAYSCGM